MLTKTDLSQIRKVIREEVETEVADARKTLETLIRITKMELKSEISDVDDRVKNVEVGVNSLDSRLIQVEKDTKDIKKVLRYIRKTVDVLIDRTDKEDVALQKRVTKIEDHLQI